MGKFQFRGKKRIHTFAFLLLFFAVALFFQVWSVGVSWGVSPFWRIVEGVSKGEVVQDDDDVQVGAGRKSNVLFFLDVGSTMTFSPTGTLPDRDAPGWTQAKAAGMLKDCTYGSGGLPLTGSTSSTASVYASRYGRDLDASNNAVFADMSLSPAAFMEKHQDNYYFPFNTTSHSLNALKVGSAGTPQPYALVMQNPSYWASTAGVTTSVFSSASALVPNDSRMYKMKLVMWRLLDDATLFEHLRIGMATSFQEQSGALYADFYKYYGADPNSFGATTTFPNGVGPSWATGLPDTTSIGGGYANSVYAYTGVLRDLYDNAKTTPTWAQINRAVLRVPISDYTTAHRDAFRTWIDGYENVTVTSGTRYYFNNPELFADGKTYLSTALYPGHPSLDRNRLLAGTTVVNSCYGVTFSSKNAQVTGSKMSANTFNYFNKGSGEAVGTVLDFFSPPTAETTPLAAAAILNNVKTAPPESFPIRDDCESNWVVVFTAGDDSQADEYSAAKAALDLFKYTKNFPVTKLKDGSGTTNTFETVRLDDGVRTIVVAFVDETNPANADLRTKLTNMAAAGDPIWNGSDWVPDTTKKPYFANDVPELIKALRAIMVRINSEIRPAKGPMTESSSLEISGTDGTFDLFSASYKVNNEDQWQGELARYQSKINSSREISVLQPAKWELGNVLMNNRTKSSSGGRKLVYWNGGSFTQLEYSTGYSDYGGGVAKLLGLQTGDMKSPSKYGGKLHPSRAMVNWLLGYDYNYANTKEIERNFMLSDFGQSGVAMVIPPTSDTLGLPGYAGWIAREEIKNRPARLFSQSNEGILHVINPIGSGVEEWAILPPPVMQPFRLATTKFSISEEGTEMKADWDDCTYDAATRSGYSSRPAYVLDGPLYLREYDMDQSGASTGWGTYLFGMLGRAGNGLYAMDVTLPNSPKFLWFRETRYQSDGRPVLITMGGTESEPTLVQDTSTNMGASSPIFANPDQYPFYQMGYNMPRAVGAVAKSSNVAFRNILALAAGYQETLDLNNNGYTGAALYILDPKNAYQTSTSAQHTKVFNSGSFSSGSLPRTGTMVAGTDPYMGMLITPPSLLTSAVNRSAASKIFTADNRGNIFMVNFESGFGSSATPLGADGWSIQAVGSLRNATGEATSADNHCIPSGILVSSTSDKSSVWISGGTANAGTRHNDNSNNNSALIRNKGQYIFAFKVDDTRVLYRNDLKKLTNDNDVLGNSDVGWLVTLKAEDMVFQEEYVTTKPVVMGGKVYCATFLPKRGSATCDSAVDGTSRVYSISLETGGGTWGHDVAGRYIEIRGIKVAGLTHSTKGAAETIIMSYAVTNKTESEADLNALAAKGLINRADGVPMLTLGESPPPDGGPPPLSTYINYWREIF